MTLSYPEWVPPLVTAMHGVLATGASAHVILTKRDVRAAIGWIGLVWLSPYLGVGLYALFGINRIQRKATSLRKHQRHAVRSTHPDAPSDELARVMGEKGRHLAALDVYMGKVTRRSLSAGNLVKSLVGGARTYEAMLAEIDKARHSIGLSSYIFNDDEVGKQIVAALARARDRGVEVRVLVDAVGARYHRPTILKALRREKIDSRLFLPSLIPSYFPYLNLRNHRKILVIDNQVGFTGGMNIDAEFDSRIHGDQARKDLHFRLEGPIVDTLREVFSEDWAFRTDEILNSPAWTREPEKRGSALARGVVDGPDDDSDNLMFAYLGGVNAARRSISIITPYFLPDARLIAALCAAAMRGVCVELFLPEVNNLTLVQWAGVTSLDEILERGCLVWAVPPPFDHTKLMVVDDCWTLFGSGNWDARSLRLNFEFNVECYDPNLAAEAVAMVNERRDVARPIRRETIKARSLPVRLRDGMARLLTPYL